MVFSPKLGVRQSQSLTQSLTMTPQLLQSIKLLQMTHFELDQFIDLEIEKNPLLDRMEAANDDLSQSEFSSDAEIAVNPSASSDEDGFEMADRPDGVADAFEHDLTDDAATDDVRTDSVMQRGALPETPYGGGSYDLDLVADTRISLSEHVERQIALAFADNIDRFIAASLGDALDESGYLRCDLLELALKLGVEPGRVERVLKAVQDFDPPGLFARDLRECLEIQLKSRDHYDAAMALMLDHLDLLARCDFVRLEKICGVDRAAIAAMLAQIRTLDPKPGALFEVAAATAIVPDVIVTASAEGGWAIELNPAVMPRLIVNNEYYAEVSPSVQADEKNFLADCMQSANWLVRSLDQRARTILKVAGEIVRQQDGFLHHGVTHLKPLNLRMVADAVGMHESTISRVTSTKFMATPRGVFELRYFFTASIASSQGEDAHSAESVRHRIRQLIAAETPENILSDDTLVEALKKDGVEIARRTVAKYRESMNIASSVQRRREKRSG